MSDNPFVSTYLRSNDCSIGIWRNGKADIILILETNALNVRNITSVVLFTQSESIVGITVKNIGKENPKKKILWNKRLKKIRRS